MVLNSPRYRIPERSSPVEVGPHQAQWDSEYDFDDDVAWDPMIRGRVVTVPKGRTVRIVKSQYQQRRRDPVAEEERIIRLTLRAVDHTLVFVVTATLDNEEILYQVPVAKNSAQSISFAAGTFFVDATHTDEQGPADARAHFRIDDRNARDSTWTRSLQIVGTGAEAEVAIPPFAQDVELYTATGGGIGTLRYYNRDLSNALALLYSEALGVPRSPSLRVNHLGLTTLQGTLGQLYLLQFRCNG